MDKNLAVPTDNIFKFAAIFGLVMMIASMTLLVFNNQNTNRIVIENAISMMDVDQASDKYKKERISLLKKHSEVVVKDRKAANWMLSILFNIGFWSSIYGFIICAMFGLHVEGLL